MAERCAHDVHPRACGVCLGIPDPMTTAEVAPWQARVFEARYAGKCRECAEPIRAGDSIALDDDRKPVHEGCQP